jgi:hypothetical protein
MLVKRSGQQAAGSGQRAAGVARLVVMVSVGVVSACGQGGVPQEHLGSTEQAVFGSAAHPDTDDPANANVVVNVSGGGGTGMMLTPHLVLTAAHVIYGSDSPGHDNQPACNFTPLPQFQIGASVGDLSFPTRHTPIRQESILQGCVKLGVDVLHPEPEAGLDFALLYIPRERSYPAEGVNIVRPSLDPSAGGPIGFAGWSPFASSAGNAPPDDQHLNFRFAAIFNSLTLSFHDGHPDHSDDPGSPPLGHVITRRPTDQMETASGDSGGPLFHVRQDGSRDVFGVLSETGACLDLPNPGACAYFTDVTRGANRQFILEHAVDNAHTDKWFASHGKTRGDYWYGEVDYVGFANPAIDQDGDHWIDEHDNCPFVANTDQVDSNDDGSGDACLCPCDLDHDKDGDTICGPSCVPGQDRNCPSSCGQPTALAKIDNCPSVWNFAQKNCNEFSEVTLNEAVLGDECDPVPCPVNTEIS